jgi:hypothetical protein
MREWRLTCEHLCAGSENPLDSRPRCIFGLSCPSRWHRRIGPHSTACRCNLPPTHPPTHTHTHACRCNNHTTQPNPPLLLPPLTLANPRHSKAGARARAVPGRQAALARHQGRHERQVSARKAIWIYLVQRVQPRADRDTCPVPRSAREKAIKVRVWGQAGADRPSKGRSVGILGGACCAGVTSSTLNPKP